MAMRCVLLVLKKVPKQGRILPKVQYCYCQETWQNYIYINITSILKKKIYKILILINKINCWYNDNE